MKMFLMNIFAYSLALIIVLFLILMMGLVPGIIFTLLPKEAIILAISAFIILVIGLAYETGKRSK